MFIDNTHAIREAIRLNKVKKLIVKDSFDLDKMFPEKCGNNLQIEILNKSVFQKRFNKTKSNILANVDFFYSDLEDLINKEKRFIIIDHIQDPQNLGTIIRAAHLFEMGNIIITSEHQVEVTPTVINASVGAIFYTKICKVINIARTIEQLKRNNYFIYASDVDAKDKLEDLSFPKKFAIILGSEGKGIRPLLLKKSDILFRIETYGNIDSLNVSQAAAIIFYEIHKKIVDV